MDRLVRAVFAFYEQWAFRNWAFTIAFLIVVPVGGRFAYLAWLYGSSFDHFMVITGGGVMGVISCIILLRFWTVGPVQTLATFSRPEAEELQRKIDVAGYFENVRTKTETNRDLARGAAALGSSRRAYRSL